MKVIIDIVIHVFVLVACCCDWRMARPSGYRRVLGVYCGGRAIDREEHQT